MDVDGNVSRPKRRGRKGAEEEDLGPIAQETIEVAIQLTKDGKLNDALEKLNAVEKRARQSSDAVAGAKVAVATVGCCFEARAYDTLMEQVQMLSKKRGQSQKALREIVQECMRHLDEIEDVEQRTAVIGTLRSVTEGKIFVEVERARLTLRLSSQLESEGKVDDASRVLQEVAVETVGSMEASEKVDLLLEQMRLTRLQRDFVRMGIIAGKVGRKIIDRRGMGPRRARYLDELVKLHTHRRDPVSLRDDYTRLYETLSDPAAAAVALEARDAAARAATGNASAMRKEGRSGGASENKEAEGTEEEEKDDGLTSEERAMKKNYDAQKDALSHVAVFACLAKFDEEAQVALHRLSRDSTFERLLPTLHGLVNLFITPEIAPWPLPQTVQDVLSEHPVFRGHSEAPETKSSRGPSSSSSSAAAAAASSSDAVDDSDPDADFWWLLLRKRVIQHNVRTAASYYQRARTPRLAKMLGLDEHELERTLADLVTDGDIWARIDRPARIVQFSKPKEPAEVLSGWSADVSKVLSLVEHTAHLVQKERMLHAERVREREATAE